MKPPYNKTKIICTIGPSSWEEKVLKKLMFEGMDIARFNLSHSTPREHLKNINKVRKIASSNDLPVGIMVDLPGVKLRIGQLQAEMLLGENSLLKIEYGRKQRRKKTVPLPNAALFKIIKKKDTIYLDDGKIELVVVQKRKASCVCKVLNSGILTSKKSIHVKGKAPNLSSPTRADLEFAKFFAKRKVDFICLSYIKNKSEVEFISRKVKQIHKNCFIVSKIETPQALDNLEEIIKVSDGVMVARGDLGLQVDITRIGALQKEIIRCAKEHSVPAIVATQILESMTTNLFPHRSEATDITNAILDGADALLLSNETSVGRFPVKAVSVLRRISYFTEQYAANLPVPSKKKPVKNDYPAAFNALAEKSGASKVVVVTDNLEAVRRMSGKHNRQDIIVLSVNKNIIRSLNLFYRVIPIFFKGKPTKAAIKKFLKKSGMLKKKEAFPLLVSLKNNYNIGIIA